MKKIWLALATVLVATSPVRAQQAAQQAEVMTVVNGFVDGFNKGDTKSFTKVCASETSIIDEFPPHEWHGTGACAAWARDWS